MIINREGCTAKRSAWKRSAWTVPCLSLTACLRANSWRLNFLHPTVVLLWPQWICCVFQLSLCTNGTQSRFMVKNFNVCRFALIGLPNNTWKWLKGKGKVKLFRRWSAESDRRRWSMEWASVCPKVVPPTILVPMSERVSSSWLEIVNTGWVGIFHLCESYSFYFHKNKVEMRDSQQSNT